MVKTLEQNPIPERDCDFNCHLPSNDNSYPPKNSCTLKVWVQPDDDKGRKIFQYIIDHEVWQKHGPSDLRYDADKQLLEVRHNNPKNSWDIVNSDHGADKFIEAYELDYVAEQTLIGNNNEE